MELETIYSFSALQRNYICLTLVLIYVKSLNLFPSQLIDSGNVHPIQIRLTRELIEKVDVMIERGIYPNRSEAIRDAVRRLKIMG